MMIHLTDSKLFDSPTAIIIALTGLVEALRRLIKSLHSLDGALPKSFWRKSAHIFDRAIKCIVKEITPPNPSPNVTKTAKVILAAMFYVLVLYCICLLIVDSILIWTSDVAIWRKLLGAAVLSIITLAGRFCFTQGEKLRIELKIDSHRLW